MEVLHWDCKMHNSWNSCSHSWRLSAVELPAGVPCQMFVYMATQEMTRTHWEASFPSSGALWLKLFSLILLCVPVTPHLLPPLPPLWRKHEQAFHWPRVTWPYSWFPWMECFAPAVFVNVREPFLASSLVESHRRNTATTNATPSWLLWPRQHRWTCSRWTALPSRWNTIKNDGSLSSDSTVSSQQNT